MRLVGHHQVRALVQHGGLKWNRAFLGQVTPVVDARSAQVGAVWRQWAAVFGADQAVGQALLPLGAADAGQALAQVVEQRRPRRAAHLRQR